MAKKISDQVKMIGILPCQGAAPIPVGKMPDDATQSLNGGTADNGTTVLHTVTAGKTFYLGNIIYQASNASGSGGTGTLIVTNATDTIQYTIYRPHLPDTGYIMDSISFSTPLEIPAGYKIKIVSPGVSYYVRSFIVGYEM